MIISTPQHACTVCLFHANVTRVGYLWPEQRNPQWAQRWLDGLERDGDVTREQAAMIRQRCGWVVQMEMGL